MLTRFLVVALALTSVGAACDGGEGSQPATPSQASTPASLTPAAEAVSGWATLYGAEAADLTSALAAGDFNGDGTLDLLVAAGFADGPANSRPDAGEAYLFLGPFNPGEQRDAAADQDATIYGADAGDGLGRAVASGDLNGDGIDDIVLGAPFADGPENARTDAGETYVILGSQELGDTITELDLAQGVADLTISGADVEDLAGFTLLTAELNGDDVDDLVIGAFWADGPDDNRPRAGEAYLLLGGAELDGNIDLASGGYDTVVYGAEADDRLAEAIAAGDVNGDGRTDLIIAAPFASGPDNSRDAAGETYVMLAPLPATIDIAAGEQDVTILGVDPGDQLGHDIASGDTDGDGNDDILLVAVSSNGYANESELAGEGALILGGELPAIVDVAQGAAALLVYGADAGDRFGRSATMGDVNGDGLADLLPAAPGGDGFRGRLNNAGEVYIFHGPGPRGELRLSQTAPDATIEGLNTGDILATEVYGKPSILVADMDGDGRGEVIASSPQNSGPDGSRSQAGAAFIFFLRE